MTHPDDSSKLVIFFCDSRGNQIVDERVEQQRQVSSKTEALNVWEPSGGVLSVVRSNGNVFGEI